MMVEEMYMTDEAKGKDWTLWLGAVSYTHLTLPTKA